MWRVISSNPLNTIYEFTYFDYFTILIFYSFLFLSTLWQSLRFLIFNKERSICLFLVSLQIFLDIGENVEWWMLISLLIDQTDYIEFSTVILGTCYFRYLKVYHKAFPSWHRIPRLKIFIHILNISFFECVNNILN